MLHSSHLAIALGLKGGDAGHLFCIHNLDNHLVIGKYVLIFLHYVSQLNVEVLENKMKSRNCINYLNKELR